MFALRIIVRFSVFGYFFAEDYIMALSWAILVSLAILIQVFLSDIYFIQNVENGVVLPTPDFADRLIVGLRADGAAIILETVGIWSIKFNFLLFFRQFGRQVQSYMTLWYIAVVVVAAAGAAHIGVIPYECTFASFAQLTGSCSTTSKISNIYAKYIGSVVVNVVSDLAVTVARGSIFGGLYKSVASVDRHVINTPRVLFWFTVEYTVSFIVACVVSFRSLWVRREQKSRDRQIELEKQKRLILAQRGSMKGDFLRQRLRQLHGSVMTTFTELEGTQFKMDRSRFIQLEPPSGNLTIDFSNWNSTDVTRPDTARGAKRRPRAL
ncbi:hypothetical protein GGR52DRAFT_592281 [Hypoxylon sp. FL1284]|nr:hypothetical protein GGR52DRAFT_592281 [Hypoxylon sp. FL1284]